MGEIVEYATTTIPLDSLPSLLQINGEFPANSFVTPTAYTTQDGETILILPQFSTLVVTGDNANAVPIQQIVSGPFTVQSDNGQTITIAQDGILPTGESYISSNESVANRSSILTIGDLGKKQCLANISSGNVIILPSDDATSSQLQIVEQQQLGIAGGSALIDVDMGVFLQEDGRYHCDRCTLDFERPRQLKRHIGEHKKEKSLKCRSCAATFNVERNLILHEASHNLTPDSSCPICDKRFLRIAGLCSHLRIHQVDDTVACELCRSEFELQSELEEHLFAMHSDHTGVQLKLRQSYDCRLCNVLFSDLARYRKHMAEHRVIEKSVRPAKPRRNNRLKPVQEDFQPPNNMATETAEAFLNPSSSAEPAVPGVDASEIAVAPPRKGRKATQAQLSNKCAQCGKAFRSKMLLDRHSLIHTGERPFACDQCEKSFNQKSALTLHKLCHTGEKPHHCQFCFASFTQRGNLRAHIKSCHRVPQDISAPNVYRCQICSCTFRRLSTYNAHLTLRHCDHASLSATAAPVTTISQPTQRKRQRIVLPAKPSTTTTTTVTQPPSDLADQPPVMRIPTTGVHSSLEASASQEQVPAVQGEVGATADQLLYTYLPIESATDVIVGEELPSYETQPQNDALPVVTGSLEVVEESYDNIAVVDPDTNSIQHHRVTRVNGVIFHCCSFCEKRFRKTNDFVRHMRIHTLEKPFACDICGNRFTNKSTLNTHLRVHAGPAAKRFRCHICRKMFASPSSLKVHLRVHTGSRPFACSFCDRKFRTSSHRQDHMMKHQKTKQVIQQRVIAQQHQRSAEPQMPGVQHFYLQQNLGAVASTTSQIQEQPIAYTTNNYNNNVETSGQPTVRPVSTEAPVDPIRKYACPHCSKAYKKSDHLRYHLESAHGSGQRSFLCQVCGKSFAMFAVLRNHIRTHAKHDIADNNYHQPSDDLNGGFSSYERSLLQHASLRNQPASDIVEQVTETATFELVSDQQQEQLLTLSPNASRVEGITATNDMEDFSTLTGDHLCFHCGRSFSSEQLVRAHVNLEHQDAMPARMPEEQRMASMVECTDQGSTIVVQSWIPAADVLPELSLSLLQPPSVSVPGNGQTGGNDSLLVENNSNQEGSSSPVMQNIRSGIISREEDGPGLLEQLAARQECPTIIIAGNMQIPPPTSMVPPSSPIVHSAPVSTRKATFRSRGIARGVIAHYHPETASLEFRCTLCGAVFYTKQSISRHMSDMHGNKSHFTCSICHRQLSSANALLLHSARCANKNKQQQMTATIELHSTDQQATTSSPTNEQLDEIHNQQGMSTDSTKAHVCKFCRRSFTKPSDLIRHERTHTGDRPFRCEQCGRSFRLKSALVGHQLTHLPADERTTFTCHLCKARLGSRTSLVVHLRRHTGVSPYHCPHCSEKFSTAGRRQSHILNTHISQAQNATATIINGDNSNNNSNDAQVNVQSPQQ